MAKTKRGTNQQRLKTRRAAVGSNNSNNDNNTTTTTTTTTNNGSGNNNNNNNNGAGISIKLLLIVSLFCLYHVRNESGSIKGISMSMTDINNIIDFTSNYTTTAAATATAASFYDPIAGNNISSDDKNNNNNNTTISHKNNNNNNVTILRSSSSKLSSSSSSSTTTTKATTTMAIKNNTINTINDNDNDNDNNISSIRDHPHAGAKYQNGSWGYIADPTIVRKRFLINYNKYQNHAAAITSTYETMEEQMMMNSNSMSTNSNNTNTNTNSNSSSIRHYLQFKDEKEMDAICNIPPGKSHEKESWNLLTQRIQIGGLHPIKPNKTKSNVSSVEVEVIIEQQTQTEKQPQLPNTINSTPFPKIFCGIYTYEKNHDMIKTITETWGWRCDGFLAFSTLTEPEIGAVHLPHYEKESYNNMWQKTRSIWAYLYDNYLDDYDFFHLSGDDNHFVIENMKNYYRSIMIEQQMNNNTDKPLYLGHFWKKHGIIVCGGGAGYTMNRKALKIFVEEVLPKCQTKMIASYEDSLVGLCFRHHTTNPTIRCGDTSDEYGSQRMTGLEPNLLATFRGKEFARPRDKSWQTIYDLYAVSSGSGLKYQEELVSSQHIALHLLRSSEWQKRIHAILYKYSCPPETIIGKVFAAADAAAAAANTAITTIAATN